VLPPRSAFAGFRFPPEVIVVAVRWFFTRALRVLKVVLVEVVTDAAPVYPGVVDELIPSAYHVERYANNPIETDHGRLKHRLRAMRRSMHRPHRTSDHRRTRLRKEPAPGPLRTRRGCATGVAGRRRVDPAGRSHLTAAPGRAHYASISHATEPLDASR
jgi:DDE domain